MKEIHDGIVKDYYMELLGRKRGDYNKNVRDNVRYIWNMRALNVTRE